MLISEQLLANEQVGFMYINDVLLVLEQAAPIFLLISEQLLVKEQVGLIEFRSKEINYGIFLLSSTSIFRQQPKKRKKTIQ